MIEDWDRNKKKGVVIKLDIEKAFDKVDQDFLDAILAAKGFGFIWRKWIRGCISSANYSIIINGRPRGKLIASRGLRQGDPLSPFLFIMVVDVFSRLMSHATNNNLIKGFDIGNGSLAIHHL